MYAIRSYYASFPSAADDIMDREWFGRMASTRRDFLRRMFDVFVREEPKRLALLEEAIAAGDFKHISFLAHSLKGATSTLGAGPAKERSAALDQARITSYNVCYTKLLRFIASGMDDYVSKPMDTGEVTAAISRALRNGTQAPEPSPAEMTRITSYNVCYTKLLRLDSFCAKEPRVALMFVKEIAKILSYRLRRFESA